MEQLTKNQAVATSQEAVQNQNEPQLRDENAHNDKSVHGVLNPTYQAGLRRDAVQPDIEAELNVITSCSVTMMLFLHLEVKPLMTLTTVLYLSCALISGHLAMMLMELTKRR